MNIKPIIKRAHKVVLKTLYIEDYSSMLSYKGPEIPCFLMRRKCTITKIKVSRGKKNVCMLYNLVKVY